MATASAPISWPELIDGAQYSGRLPVVIPTGSYPMVGYFDPKPQFEISFALACYSDDARVRCHAIAAALWSARVDAGID